MFCMQEIRDTGAMRESGRSFFGEIIFCRYLCLQRESERPFGADSCNASFLGYGHL